MDEDLDALTTPGFSMKQQSPVLTRRFTDPLGLMADEARSSKRKPSQDLEQMFPHGESCQLVPLSMCLELLEG